MLKEAFGQYTKATLEPLALYAKYSLLIDSFFLVISLKLVDFATWFITRKILLTWLSLVKTILLKSSLICAPLNFRWCAEVKCSLSFIIPFSDLIVSFLVIAKSLLKRLMYYQFTFQKCQMSWNYKHDKSCIWSVWFRVCPYNMCNKCQTYDCLLLVQHIGIS